MLVLNIPAEFKATMSIPEVLEDKFRFSSIIRVYYKGELKRKIKKLNLKTGDVVLYSEASVNHNDLVEAIWDLKDIQVCFDFEKAVSSSTG